MVAEAFMRFAFVALAALALVGGIDSAQVGSGNSAVKPTNLDQVNTTADEDDPFITADGLSLYYASNAAGSFDICVSTRRSGAAWPAGKVAADINTKEADERSPFVSRDGKLYFATNVVPDEKFKDLKNFDLKVRVGTRAPLMEAAFRSGDRPRTATKRPSP